ncbi:MAG: ABC transporter permease subunit [Thermomicrobiales bacterium]
MGRYVVRRLIQAAIMIFVVASLVAVFIQFIPGDPAYVILGEERATEDRVEAIRDDLGLNRPIYEQYADWLSGVVRGDLGESLISGRPIRTDLQLRIPRTFELGGAAVLISVLVGIPLGVIAARSRNSLPDVLATSFAILGLSVPVFVVGPLLVLLLSVKTDILPASGYVPFQEDPVEHLKRLALPAFTLGVLSSATIIRMTRSSVLEVLGEDYVRSARSRGLGERSVLFTHALRNALIPVVTIIGLQMGTLLGSSVLVEYIFNWPGVSTYLIDGINRRDYPIVQAVILVIAVTFILLNLLTDLIYAWIDPRIKYGSGEQVTSPTVSDETAVEAEGAQSEGLSQLTRSIRPRTPTWRILLQNPRVTIPGAAILLLLVMALFAPWLAPKDPLEINAQIRLEGPSSEAWLGTDENGRDLLSRIIVGSRTSMTVAILSVTVATILGVGFGLIGGYFGGIWEFITMRSVDVLLVFPPILLAISVVAFLGPSTRNLILVIGLLYMTRFARIAFGSVVQVKGLEYVEAARVLGAETRESSEDTSSEYSRADLRPDIAQPRLRDSARIGPVVPRSGHAAAESLLGQHDRRGPGLSPAKCLVCLLALADHLDRNPQLQYPRRRPAGFARSAVAAVGMKEEG